MLTVTEAKYAQNLSLNIMGWSVVIGLKRRACSRRLGRMGTKRDCRGLPQQDDRHENNIIYMYSSHAWHICSQAMRDGTTVDDVQRVSLLRAARRSALSLEGFDDRNDCKYGEENRQRSEKYDQDALTTWPSAKV
jgi:hypothetical protein